MTDVVFYIYVLPVIAGLLFGACLCRVEKSYIVSWVMLFGTAVWWCVLSHINTHGSEGPGLLAWTFSLFTLSFSAFELIKFVKRRCTK